MLIEIKEQDGVQNGLHRGLDDVPIVGKNSMNGRHEEQKLIPNEIEKEDARPAKPVKSSQAKQIFNNHKKFPTIYEEDIEESEKDILHDNEAKI